MCADWLSGLLRVRRVRPRMIIIPQVNTRAIDPSHLRSGRSGGVQSMVHPRDE